MMNLLYVLLDMYPLTAFVCLGVFSLLIGSFLNVVIYRLPLMLQAEWRTDCCNLLTLPTPEPNTMNLLFPRSFCTECKKTIAAWWNIPIISYCLLRGRCQQCKTPISLQYPLIELFTCLLSLAAAWHMGFGLKLLFALPFIWMLIVLCFIDLKHQILPDSITLSLLWLGLLANTQGLFTTLPNAVFSAAGAYLSLWLFIQLFYLVTGKIGMGNGDFKLFAAFGAWFGGMVLPFILIASSLTGALIGIAYLNYQKKNKDTPIPFGPFLCLSGLVALFYGQSVIELYLHML